MTAATPPKPAPSLIDPFQRAITYLRVSVTDRCDFRCLYCMAEEMTFLPKRDRERIRAMFWSTTEGDQTRGDVFPIVTKDGREREVEWYDKILEDQDGSIIGVLATGQDVTERKQAEVQAEALAHAATALKSLDVDEVLDRILEQTQRVIPYQVAMILMVEGSQLYLARHHGLEDMPEVRDSLDTVFEISLRDEFA